MPTADCLFVYGTLMSGFDNAPARGLRAAATLVGPATLRGRMLLVDSGRAFRYPAVIDSDDPADPVHGELWRLHDVGVLAELDAYEGPEYQRVTRPVTLADGRTVAAQVYLYIDPTAGLAPIPSGRFADAG